MISTNTNHSEVEDTDVAPDHVALVRYGLIPQVARFGLTSELAGQISDSAVHRLSVVVESDRGTEVGELLEVIRAGIVTEAAAVTGQVHRIASEDDLTTYEDNRRQSESEFFEWQDRIEEWSSRDAIKISNRNCRSVQICCKE